MSLKSLNCTTRRVLVSENLQNGWFSVYLGGSKWAKKWKSRKCGSPFQDYSVTNEGLYAVDLNGTLAIRGNWRIFS